MKQFLELLTNEFEEAFEQAGYDRSYGKVTISNRPDLCEFQCNGAMAGAKKYKKAPFMIAEEVVEIVRKSPLFSYIEVVRPGFINLNANQEFLKGYLNEMMGHEDLGLTKNKNPKTVLVDYGGPNVAKPLHVGHLRSAIIGESIKRIIKKMGDKALGDIHMGDWGYQMGLIITEVKLRNPELVYFDETFKGEYPKEAPFTISELEEIYPTASKKAKEDDHYREEALHATVMLQAGDPGYRAIWQHIMAVSVADLKKNYSKLNVDFDLWYGESDAQKYIQPMVEKMKADGYAYEDEGALVVDVKKDSDTKEIPPCIILKSDGASLYSTTDLATIVQREESYKPDALIYLADKRQDLHFLQVFRTAIKTGLVPKDTKLEFLGFGTMNGKDGKPFKTREGGIMRLETLIGDIQDEMLQKIKSNRTMEDEEAKKIADTVGLAALKYADLSNQAAKDYIFDIERFTSFEGNTGPYILYTIVRIKSILNKYEGDLSTLNHIEETGEISKEEKELMLELVRYNEVIKSAYDELAPHKICAYIYNVSNAFNKFYHGTKILAEEDEIKKKGYLSLLLLTREILESCIDLLGFYAPEKM